MKCTTGDAALQRAIENAGCNSFKARYALDGIMEYLRSGEDNKIYALHGLPRTGKTILMLQAIKKLGKLNETCLGYCENEDDMGDIHKLIRSYPSCRYFFFDNITRLDNFVATASILADYYAADENKKIVVAGTDTKELQLAFNTELVDRVYVSRLTYVSFKEYCYLFGEHTLDWYICNAGPLTGGNIFRSKDLDYLQTLANSMLESLKKFRDGGWFGSLLSYYSHGGIHEFIAEVIKYAAALFLREAVSRFLGITNKKIIYSAMALEESRWIRQADPSAIKAVYSHLAAMDVMRVNRKQDGTDEVRFIQSGFCYVLVENEINRLAESQRLANLMPQQKAELIQQMFTATKMLLKEQATGERQAVFLAENGDVIESEPYLARKAVDLAHQKAAALEVPHYYVEDGWLVEDKAGKKKLIKKIVRNAIWNDRKS